ncbi:hypothetical protein JW992_11470 [candidate division KSB1 bacterium]|nr:hypothetical protein [candidate division KSB1 bacterium]
MIRLTRQVLRGTIAFCCFVALGHTAPLRSSIDFFPTANGIAFAAFDLGKSSVTHFQCRLVDVWDNNLRTVNRIEETGFELVVQGNRLRIASLPVEQIAYVNGTGIIRVERKVREFRTIEYIWSPMILDFPALIQVLHIPDAQRFRIHENQIQPFLLSDDRDIYAVRSHVRQPDGLWIASVLVHGQGLPQDTLVALQKELSRALPDKLLEAEQRWWMHWHGAENSPVRIYGKPYEVLQQSAAFLKMAQCREPGKSYGQIVRHLSTKQPKVAVPRDMAYAVVALSELGHYFEAKAALQFMMSADAGYYRRKNVMGSPWGMNRDYRISVHHYAGAGFERSEIVAGHPLIHFDGHGLFLWALQTYVKKSSDSEYGRRIWPKVESSVIFPLIEQIDETGLIQNDSGLWSVSAPGQHFSFTSCSAYLGLNQAAIQARSLGDTDFSNLLVRTGVHLRNAILSKLLVGKSGVIKKSLEAEGFPWFLDGSTVEAINWKVVLPDWKTAGSTLNALHSFLQVGGGRRGYALGYIDASTPGPENLFVDMRAVVALRACHKRKQADQLLGWIVDQVSVNGEMVPEFFSYERANYLGTYPVIGMGAGCLILAIVGE